MTNSIGHRVIAISRIFLNDQYKFLPWWLLSKSEYNVILALLSIDDDANDYFSWHRMVAEEEDAWKSVPGLMWSSA